MSHPKSFAEVIESSLHTWLAQTWQWDYFPLFGSLVSVNQGNRVLIGLVHSVQTGSIEANRHPFAYQKTEEELYREQPQIFEFLKTTFSTIILGYQENNTDFYMLAPEPVKIHAFVQNTPDNIHKRFLNNSDYLHVLFGLSRHIDNFDELLLAFLKNNIRIIAPTDISLKDFFATYSLLIGNDYRRLKMFLHRAQHIIVNHTNNSGITSY